MSATLQEPFSELAAVVTSMPAEVPRSIELQLLVTDRDSVMELFQKDLGRKRDEYALSGLHIGLLSLKQARGQIDADIVRREGDRLLKELSHSLNSYKTQMNDGVTSVLREYFDPNSGRFQERIERLIQEDGELEQTLRRQIGEGGSELVRTLALHVGENSPIMKLLDPDDSSGLVQVIKQSAEELFQAERERVLAEFSLDNKSSALSRMVIELAENNGRLASNLSNRIDDVVKEFSLDTDDSALSRLVRKVETAQRTITDEFSLDNERSALSRMSGLLNQATDGINNNLTLDKEGSALSRLRREIIATLQRHEEQATVFQREMTSALEAMKAKREESLRSTTHGKEFQDVVVEFVQREAERSGDLATCTGATTGLIKHCKNGDAVVELGPDCAAAGEKLVVEAKEVASYGLAEAREEIEKARNNRGASVGLFVVSKKTAPSAQESLLRYGNDVFVIWDAEDLGSDVVLKAAVSLAKALCVRESKARDAEAADFVAIDNAILAIEKEAQRLEKMKTWTETINSSGGKILNEVRKMTAGLEEQLAALRDAVSGLKDSVA